MAGLFVNPTGSDNMGSKKFQQGGIPLNKFIKKRRFGAGLGPRRRRRGSITRQMMPALLVGTFMLAVILSYGANAAENVELSSKTIREGADPAGTVDRMAGIKARVRKTYPGVPQLSVEEFAKSGADKLLVDVRAQSEYSVSHIPGAVHIDDPAALLAYAKANPGKELVLYCSVGMRSSKAAAALQKQGISRVTNLEGSIFQWANDHRPLVDAKGATEEVHPYNAFWGWRYLD